MRTLWIGAIVFFAWRAYMEARHERYGWAAVNGAAVLWFLARIQGVIV